jgi:hypothetical protein
MSHDATERGHRLGPHGGSWITRRGVHDRAKAFRASHASKDVNRGTSDFDHWVEESGHDEVLRARDVRGSKEGRRAGGGVIRGERV